MRMPATLVWPLTNGKPVGARTVPLHPAFAHPVSGNTSFAGLRNSVGALGADVRVRGRRRVKVNLARR